MTKLYEKIKNGKFIISGPCVLEDYDKSLMIANFASQVCKKYGFTYIFKASFDKANRTSMTAYRGPGIDRGLEIFKALSKDFYTLTDIHTMWYFTDPDTQCYSHTKCDTDTQTIHYVIPNTAFKQHPDVCLHTFSHPQVSML